MMNVSKHLLGASVTVVALLLAAAGSAFADTIDATAASGFSVSVFAQGNSAMTAPDSLAVVGNSVFAVYTNNADPTGVSGNGTLVKYNLANGAVEGTTTVGGSTDGLKYDAATGMLWATHNEDANAYITLINPNTLRQSSPYPVSASPHGGGYDDLAFLNGKVYVSASNPALNASNHVLGGPSIVSVQLANNQAVITPVLANTAPALNLLTGKTGATNQTDPDSMTTTPQGGLLLSSQGDGTLLFVHNVGLANQSVDILPLTNTLGNQEQVDDSVLPTSSSGCMLIADKHDNAVLSLCGNKFNVSGLYSAGQDGVTNAYSVGEVNPNSGVYTPILTGINGSAGEVFISNIPEPASLGLLLGGTVLIIGVTVLKKREIS
jgi:hypothetical protein